MTAQTRALKTAAQLIRRRTGKRTSISRAVDIGLDLVIAIETGSARLILVDPKGRPAAPPGPPREA